MRLSRQVKGLTTFISPRVSISFDITGPTSDLYSEMYAVDTQSQGPLELMNVASPNFQ